MATYEEAAKIGHALYKKAHDHYVCHEDIETDLKKLLEQLRPKDCKCNECVEVDIIFELLNDKSNKTLNSFAEKTK